MRLIPLTVGLTASLNGAVKLRCRESRLSLIGHLDDILAARLASTRDQKLITEDLNGLPNLLLARYLRTKGTKNLPNLPHSREKWCENPIVLTKITHSTHNMGNFFV